MEAPISSLSSDKHPVKWTFSDGRPPEPSCVHTRVTLASSGWGSTPRPAVPSSPGAALSVQPCRSGRAVPAGSACAARGWPCAPRGVSEGAVSCRVSSSRCPWVVAAHEDARPWPRDRVCAPAGSAPRAWCLSALRPPGPGPPLQPGRPARSSCDRLAWVSGWPRHSCNVALRQHLLRGLRVCPLA